MMGRSSGGFDFSITGPLILLFVLAASGSLEALLFSPIESPIYTSDALLRNPTDQIR